MSGRDRAPNFIARGFVRADNSPLPYLLTWYNGEFDTLVESIVAFTRRVQRASTR